MKTGERLLHIEYNSTSVSGDSLMVSGQNRVFRSGSELKDTLSSHYPLSQNIQRELTPDWILFILIAILLVLAWIRLTYNKYIVSLLEASVNYQRSAQVYGDPGIVQKRIFLIFNFIYFITGGLYIFFLMNNFAWYPFELKDLWLFLADAGFLAGLMFFRTIVLKLTGHIFNRYKLYNEYIFQSFLFNKITGIVLIPFIIGIAYTRGFPKEIIIYVSLFAVAGIFILRFARLLMFIFKNVVLLSYLILYLCTLEILPMLVIVKLILSLA